MSVRIAPDEPGEVDTARARRAEGRAPRRPGPPAAFGWRWLHPLVLAGLAVLALVLSATGARLVLDSRDGTVDRAITDPTQPGYTEVVAPTPTLLVVHGDAQGTLYSVLLLALPEGEQGPGRGVVLTPDVIVNPGTDDGSWNLGRVYEEFGATSTTSGGASVASVVADLFGSDPGAVVTFDAASFAPLLEPVAPLEVTVDDTVRGPRGATILPEGVVEVESADDIAAVTESLGTDEEPIARADRQIAFWQAWIDAVAALPDPSSAFPLAGDGADLGRFLRALGAAPDELTLVPNVVFQGAPVPAANELVDLAAEMIPFPQQAGERLTVALRNGTGDFTLDDPMIRLLVDSRAQILSRGNADSFDVAATTVTYHHESVRDEAHDLAERIGDANVEVALVLDSPYDVTVTIGKDFVP